jgi:hypothetical protein
MASKKKTAGKRSPARKSAKKAVRKTVRKTVVVPPPTIAGVFQLVSTKRGFLDKLLTDMNVALTSAKLELPPADRESLQKMLTATYQMTGADVLRIFDTWRSLKVAPPPPPWSITPEPHPPVQS